MMVGAAAAAAVVVVKIMRDATETRMWADANVMATLANIGGASIPHHKVWLMPTAGVPCSNTAKMRNLLKLAGLPHTNEMILAASGPKFAILSGRVDEVLLLNKFFFQLSIHALVVKI